ARKRVELVHHGVDGFLEQQDLSADTDRDLPGEVTAGNGGGDIGNVADLAGQGAGHGVHRVREVLPPAGRGWHDRLTAQLAVGAPLAGYAGDFRGEGTELVHHGVESVFQHEDFASHVHGDLAGEVAAGDGGGHFGDVAHLSGQI